MEKRRILLEDGRYLIYYTFEDSAGRPEREPQQVDPRSEEPKEDTRE